MPALAVGGRRLVARDWWQAPPLRTPRAAYLHAIPLLHLSPRHFGPLVPCPFAWLLSGMTSFRIKHIFSLVRR